jgi:hypothetical protein
MPLANLAIVVQMGLTITPIAQALATKAIVVIYVVQVIAIPAAIHVIHLVA